MNSLNIKTLSKDSPRKLNYERAGKWRKIKFPLRKSPPLHKSIFLAVWLLKGY